MNALAASTSETYKLLVSLLAKCPRTIEILPGDGSVWMDTTVTQKPTDTASEPSFAPFLFVEGNLGVPQKILYEIYLHVISVFRSARGCVPTGPMIMIQRNTSDLNASEPLVCALAASSSILLLANPAHQTALNARKHLVKMDLIDPQAELRFTASLLSSQHCAKHAELWYHRRWILSSAFRTQSSATADPPSSCRLRFASREVLEQELELTSRACELYPRNYFAWMHRLICIRSLLSDYLSGADSVGFVAVFRNELARTKGWINCHVSDYSAIHTVLSLSKAAFDSGDSALIQAAIEEDLLDHAILLVQEYPTHEALWMYIRMAIFIPHQKQVQLIRYFIEHFVHPLIHLQHSKIVMKEDLVKASQHAGQFLSRVDSEYHKASMEV